MPTEEAQAAAEFMTMYKNLQSAISYNMQWSDQIASLSSQIQTHPHYEIALKSDEQTLLQSVAGLARTYLDNIKQAYPDDVAPEVSAIENPEP